MKSNSFIASILSCSLLVLTGCTNVKQFSGLTSPVSAPTTTASVASTCQSLALPMYIYPSYLGSGWNTAVSDSPWSSKVKRVFIMNPDSGPGAAANSDYQNIAATVHKAGGLVYGYVYTNYGAVSLTSAESQVAQYQSWYGVDGIFVDASSADPALVSTYYQPFATYITGQIAGAGVMLNAGVYPDPSYAAITVPTASSLRIVVFEDDYTTFASAGGIPAWATNYPASMFVDIVYNTPSADLASALQLSVQRNVGSVFITDGVLPNPYGQLPSYWSNLAAETQSGCST